MSELDNIKNSGDLDFQFKLADKIKEIKKWPRIQEILKEIPWFDNQRKVDTNALIKFVALFEMKIDTYEEDFKTLNEVIKTYRESNERLLKLLEEKKW